MITVWVFTLIIHSAQGTFSGAYPATVQEIGPFESEAACQQVRNDANRRAYQFPTLCYKKVLRRE